MRNPKGLQRSLAPSCGAALIAKGVTIMKLPQYGRRVIGLFSVILAFGFQDSFAQTLPPNAVLAQVTFSNVGAIRTGELANFTGANQRIAFEVSTSQVTNTNTGEVLSFGPTAFFAVRNLAFESDDAAHSTRYCLSIVRSLALTPKAGTKMTLFLNVTQQSPGGPNFIVHTFASCNLELANP
jgi:hypothetical protein